MKNTIKVLALLMILAICLLTLTGCATKLDGKYTLVSMSSGEETIDASMYEALGLSFDDCFIEFKKDGTCKMSMFGESMEGTYEAENKKTITITINDEPGSGTIDGKKITITEDETSMVFEKK